MCTGRADESPLEVDGVLKDEKKGDGLEEAAEEEGGQRFSGVSADL